MLCFSVAEDGEGKLKAYNVSIEGQQQTANQKPPRQQRTSKPYQSRTEQKFPAKPKKNHPFSIVAVIALLAFSAGIIWNQEEKA